MSIQSQIQKLTVDEKIMAMELLWKELCTNEDNVMSPDWHRQVIQQREGNEHFIDWSEAKKQIKDSV
ncbi:MAG: addiction module protein [Marinicella sp.]